MSTQLKKHYVMELEYFIQHLNENISYEITENVTLKETIGAAGVAPQVQPPPEMYPHLPPWMSCTPPYMTKRLG